MSRFKNEIATIPAGVWLAAAGAYSGFAAFLWFVVLADPRFPPAERVAFAALPPLVVAIYALVGGYIFNDAKRRGMRHVMWTLLAVFIPNGIGIILYFLLREPVVAPCPACGAAVKGHFAFCPSCGAAVHPACPVCRKAVEAGWKSCAYCGSELNKA
ncbi:MAG TPA: hypothetical protein DEH78_32480 [Solibacterales bacterium]|nr:hypothetical protein [Bryobacterales bacterium]